MEKIYQDINKTTSAQQKIQSIFSDVEQARSLSKNFNQNKSKGSTSSSPSMKMSLGGSKSPSISSNTPSKSLFSSIITPSKSPSVSSNIPNTSSTVSSNSSTFGSNSSTVGSNSMSSSNKKCTVGEAINKTIASLSTVMLTAGLMYGSSRDYIQNIDQNEKDKIIERFKNVSMNIKSSKKNSNIPSKLQLDEMYTSFSNRFGKQWYDNLINQKKRSKRSINEEWFNRLLLINIPISKWILSTELIELAYNYGCVDISNIDFSSQNGFVKWDKIKIGEADLSVWNSNSGIPKYLEAKYNDMSKESMFGKKKHHNLRDFEKVVEKYNQIWTNEYWNNIQQQIDEIDQKEIDQNLSSYRSTSAISKKKEMDEYKKQLKEVYSKKLIVLKKIDEKIKKLDNYVKEEMFPLDQMIIKEEIKVEKDSAKKDKLILDRMKENSKKQKKLENDLQEITKDFEDYKKSDESLQIIPSEILENLEDELLSSKDTELVEGNKMSQAIKENIKEITKEINKSQIENNKFITNISDQLSSSKKEEQLNKMQDTINESKIIASNILNELGNVLN